MKWIRQDARLAGQSRFGFVVEKDVSFRLLTIK